MSEIEKKWAEIFQRLEAKEIDSDTAIQLLIEAGAHPADAADLVGIANGGSDVIGNSEAQ